MGDTGPGPILNTLYDETIVNGFDNAPSAYLDMLSGMGLGKRSLRVAD
jgi:NADPH-dependent curcumin reductase CurA